MNGYVRYGRIITIPVANVQVGDVLVLNTLTTGLQIQSSPKHLMVIDVQINDGNAYIKFKWPEFNIEGIPLWRTVDMNATATFLGGAYDA